MQEDVAVHLAVWRGKGGLAGWHGQHSRARLLPSLSLAEQPHGGHRRHTHGAHIRLLTLLPFSCLPADPPFQWGMLRTNEVLIEVDGDAAQS